MCSISGCDRARTRLNDGTRSVFCADHKAKERRNYRRRDPRPRRARSVRPEGISPQDWSAYLASLAEYRERALDAAFTAAVDEWLGELDPLSRHLARERLARVAGETPYSKVLDLALAEDPTTGEWRVEQLVPIRWP